MGRYEKGTFQKWRHKQVSFHLAIPANCTTARLQSQCGHWNWGGTVSSSMALWLWVTWGTATDQLCLIIIFYNTQSRKTFSTHETYQVQSTSEQEMLDSCCYSFSERQTGWEEGMRLGGSFTVNASYFPLWFLRVNWRVHKVHRKISKSCHYPVIIVFLFFYKFQLNVQCEMLIGGSVTSEQNHDWICQNQRSPPMNTHITVWENCLLIIYCQIQPANQHPKLRF